MHVKPYPLDLHEQLGWRRWSHPVYVVASHQRRDRRLVWPVVFQDLEDDSQQQVMEMARDSEDAEKLRLIVTLLREARRPLTVKELSQEMKRRGFQSQSSNFSKMLANRARELKRKGVLRGAVGQPGYVLAQPTSG